MLEPVVPVHRIGGAATSNLALKPAEERLDPAGFSVLLGETPQEAAEQMRRVFADPVQFARLHVMAETVATATVGEIRSAGFDVVVVATGRLPNHGRVIHPLGVAGFTPNAVARLAAMMRVTATPRS